MQSCRENIYSYGFGLPLARMRTKDRVDSWSVGLYASSLINSCTPTQHYRIWLMVMPIRSFPSDTAERGSVAFFLRLPILAHLPFDVGVSLQFLLFGRVRK